MTKASILLSLFTAIIFLSFNTHTTIDDRQLINPVIGDISFINKFGQLPDKSTDEDLRIKTHLEYVENLLRQKNVSDLSHDLQLKRKKMLDLLHEYWTAGNFPRNYDYFDQRKPCFIDKDERICAVGYLVEQTAGRQTAKSINRKHKYEKIFEMNDSGVDNWIASSGLTKEECAMIQPTYGPPPVFTENYISPAYGISSAILSGVNLSLNTLNGVQLSKGANNNAVPIIGLLTGAGQVVLGIGNFPKEDWSGGAMYATTNESQKVLSMVNIGFGTTTMILSTWNLIANRQSKPKQTSWNLFALPTGENNVAFAFSLSRRF